MRNNILILGADGMLGHTVYSYLHLKFPHKTFGTARNNSKFLLLNADALEKDFEVINKKIGKIDFALNCIGILRDGNKKTMFSINSEFPQKLAQLSEKYNFRLIHVSSDAVYPPTSGKVTENDVANPKDDYGKSKLMGEPISNNSISIRTSLIGIDSVKHKGLLEWAIKTKKPISGFINQTWSGSTTLQFAKLCKDIIQNNDFPKLRKQFFVFHFSPLGPITKYELLKQILTSYKKNTKIMKDTANPVNRSLSSNFAYFTDKKYTNNVSKALNELILFEKKKLLYE